jgi:hypothetical protein
MEIDPIEEMVAQFTEDGLEVDDAVERVLSIVEFIDNADTNEELDEVPSSWEQIAAIGLYMAKESA